MSDSLRPHGLYSPWDSPGQNTGVGSLSLLQGIFPSQGSNPGLPHCRRILYQLSYQGSQESRRLLSESSQIYTEYSREWCELKFSLAQGTRALQKHLEVAENQDWAWRSGQRGRPEDTEGSREEYAWLCHLPPRGNGTLLQYSCPEDPMDGEAW